MARLLTPDLIEAFAGTFLSCLYDDPKPTPAFHRDCWKLYCTPAPFAALAAPRGHAKSTALTHVFGLATALFRVEDYILIVSATEDLAIGHLGDIAKELRENEDLRAEFGIRNLPTDAKTDVVVSFTDGHQCRFLAKGSGQKLRGLKWNGKRPGLILCDDIEEDEQVASRDRRQEFGNWFRRALMPCRRQSGKIRVHGTILDEDALLARLLKSPSWLSHKFRAHNSFDDFSGILWPGQFTETSLRLIRQSFIDDGDAAGYSQEYLNDPYDNEQAYLRRQDFHSMDDEDFARSKIFKVGCDFAVSKKDHANQTSFTVGGKDQVGLIHIIDQLIGRWDATEWIDRMFEIQRTYQPDEFIVEGGTIWSALEMMVTNQMRARDMYLSIRVINPVRDKATRAKPFQRRHRAGGMRFDKNANWYPAYEAELLRFTGITDAREDDQFDSTALLVRGFEESPEVEEEDFFDAEDWGMIEMDPRRLVGRSAVTGY